MASKEVTLGLVYGASLDLSFDSYEWDEKPEILEFINNKIDEINKKQKVIYKMVLQSDYEKVHGVAIGVAVPDLPQTDPWNMEYMDLESYEEIGKQFQEFVSIINKYEKKQEILSNLNKIIEELCEEFELKYESKEELYVIRTTSVHEDKGGLKCIKLK